MSSPGLPPMPWFGIDVGGTLTKLVYFEPSDDMQPRSAKEERLVSNIRHYLLTNAAYGDSGHRDVHLQMDDAVVSGQRGRLHFIRFPTAKMGVFIELARQKGMAELASTVCATGGGAHKFQDRILDVVGMNLHKFDEIDSLVRGVEFLETYHRQELFYYEDARDEASCVETPYNANMVYPFLLVNIGSGVSILSVRGPDEYRRVHGTSLGGGTFLGLCCLLTNCKTFEEALDLAARGDNRNVDKLVRDIYGGDYDRFGLGGDVVASSFGQMNCPAKCSEARPEDLARATLVTITNNIGSLARLCARSEAVERVVFVGNFLRINPISMKLLACAMEFWSGGATKALFCRHEGYFGAVGCLLELMKTCEAGAQ